MALLSVSASRLILPAPSLAITAWLLEPLSSIDAEIDAELRQSLIRRLEAVLASAAITLFVSVLAYLHHGGVELAVWAIAEVALDAVRLPLVIYILRTSRSVDSDVTLSPAIVDLFVCVGSLWSALLGVGAMMCIMTGDPGLSIVASLVTMGTIGAQGVRSPGSPRLNILQMCLIVLPFTVGAITTTIPLAGWLALLMPLYLFGMISITGQAHREYVGLICFGIENARRAMHCPLTGLPNRASFNANLSEALKRAGAEGRDATVLCLDLDGFKRVNDGFGHLAGDIVLKQVADRLRTIKTPGLSMARLGGDEFAMLLKSGGTGDAECIARSVIEALGRPYDLGADGTVRIGVSVGLASSLASDTPTDIVVRADQALYMAKRAGKGVLRWGRLHAQHYQGAEGNTAIVVAA